MRAFSKRPPKKNVSSTKESKSLNKYDDSRKSVDATEHAFNIVCSHLRKTETYNSTIKKFPPRALYSAVKRFIEQSPSEQLDIAVTFESLKSYDTVDSFLEDLQKEHVINKTYSDGLLEDLALEELTAKAEILNKKIINKHEIALSRNEYYYLKRCESELRKLKRSADSWPLSLS